MRFKYRFKDILQYIFKGGCFRSKKKMAKDPVFRKHILFEKGADKIQSELDCVTLVKAIRTLKLIK